jgi:hypothetical protein
MSSILRGGSLTRFLIITLTLLVLVQVGGAQSTSGSEPVDRIEQFFLTGRLDRAELEALRLLSKPTGLTDFERGELYRILAYSAVARDDPELAKQYFRNGLSHNANLRLDRNLTSPKILEVFDQARVEYKQVTIKDRDALIDDLKSFRLRIEGGKRSMMLPGLGQFHKGHSLRGNLMLGAAGLSIVGLAYSQVMVMDTEDRYQNAEDPFVAASNYDDYQLYWNMRYGFGFAIAAIWLGSTLEAFLTPPNESAYSRITLELAYDMDSHTPMTGLAIHF